MTSESMLLTPGLMLNLAEQNGVPVTIETIGGNTHTGTISKQDGYGVVLQTGLDLADMHGVTLIVKASIASIQVDSFERLTRQPIEAHAL